MKSLRFLLPALFVVCLLSNPALAKKSGHGGGNGGGPGQWSKSVEERTYGKGDKADETDLTLRFTNENRERIRAYLKENYGASCPPGLAKKNNGCLPPGQAKRYGIGGTLPDGWTNVPQGLLARLGPPPAGTFYTMVDKDVVLASEATKKVLDAVTLLSAME